MLLQIAVDGHVLTNRITNPVDGDDALALIGTPFEQPLPTGERTSVVRRSSTVVRGRAR